MKNKLFILFIFSLILILGSEFLFARNITKSGLVDLSSYSFNNYLFLIISFSITLVKVLIISSIVYLGLWINNFTVDFFKLYSIVFICESVFLFPEYLDFFDIEGFSKNEISLSFLFEKETFFYLFSLFFNFYEIVYWIFLSVVMSIFFKAKIDFFIKVILSFYVPFLFCWVVFVMFISLGNS